MVPSTPRIQLLGLLNFVVVLCKNKGNEVSGGFAVICPVECPKCTGAEGLPLILCSELKYFVHTREIGERNFWEKRVVGDNKVLRRQATPAFSPGGKNAARIEGHYLNQFG